MKVEQLMTKTVASCVPGDTLNEAARIMWERDCGVVPVVEAQGSQHVIGMLTDRDICMAAYTKGQTLSQIQVRDAMSSGAQSCHPGQDVAEAERAMRDAQVHRLPVVDEADQLLGVISLADIAREAAREARFKRQEVTVAEVGETLAAISQPRESVAIGTA
jgi:CBS domain-containing protein